MDDFVIDTTIIYQLENAENNTVYSMRVYPKETEGESDSTFYNLYLYSDGSDVTESIIKYYPEKEWLENYLIGKSQPYNGTSEEVYSNRAAPGCFMEMIIAPCEYGYYHEDSDCDGSGWVTAIVNVCGSSGGGGGGNSGGGGGGSGGGLNNPGGVFDGIIIPGGNQGFDPEGGGNSYSDTPCGSLAKLASKSDFKQRVQSLNKPDTLNLNREVGYFVSDNPNNSNLGYHYVTNAPDTNYIPNATNNEVFGIIHTHKNNSTFSDGDTQYVFKLPSHLDLRQLARMYKKRLDAGLPTEDVFIMAISADGIFTIKITDEWALEETLEPGGVFAEYPENGSLTPEQQESKRKFERLERTYMKYIESTNQWNWKTEALGVLDACMGNGIGLFANNSQMNITAEITPTANHQDVNITPCN